LEQNAWQQALNEFAARLQEAREVVILLEPLRVDLNNEGSPALGPDDAPVTLVEFSDFECPYCGSFFTTLKRLEENYGDKLRVVYRQYPLEMHPNAFKAAEASLCAYEQGQFWEMHDLMLTEQDRLDVESLKQNADRLGLDREEFDACLESGRYAEQILRDAGEGNRIGIEGTPAIFVNGIPLQGGAVPYEVAAEVIDEELRRAAR
jgi:protein-disulfide isomerase